MNAVCLNGFGDPAKVVALMPEPERHAGDRELLVALEAAPVHPSDLHLSGASTVCRGFYGLRPGLPAPLGVEGVGRVVEVGPGADQDHVGRRVVILPTYEQGTWADHAAVAVDNVVVVSDDADALQLAMVGVNPLTALLLLRLPERLSQGDWIAQTGANSAVGQYVITLAKLAGVKTLNLVRREPAAAQVTAAGGDRVIVVGDDLPRQLERALEGDELALVLDSIGGPSVVELAHRLRWLRQASSEDINARYREIAGLVTSGKLGVEIDQTYPLEHYAEALGHAEQYQRLGKVLFTFGDKRE
jgi:NADPH:quinone reductase-like Zn-dependent oxidoreductase